MKSIDYFYLLLHQGTKKAIPIKPTCEISLIFFPSCLVVKRHIHTCVHAHTTLLQILHISCGTIKKKNKVGGGFVAQPLSQRRVNTVLGKIYVFYLWSSRDEPIGLKDWTQRSVL